MIQCDTKIVQMINVDTRDRLMKLLGMLGSHHDGEIASAGRKVHELHKRLGKPWDELLAPADGYQQKVKRHRDQEWQVRVDQMYNEGKCAFMKENERNFIMDMHRKRFATEKQEAWIEGLWFRFYSE